MDTAILIRQQLTKAINELPVEVLPELATFIDYLRFKVTSPIPSPEPETLESSGSAFLLSIANLGAADEDDISERDEEILTNEIDPIRGWSLKQDNP
jgi:hypothetical protein